MDISMTEQVSVAFDKNVHKLLNYPELDTRDTDFARDVWEAACEWQREALVSGESVDKQDVVDLVPGEQKPECPNCDDEGHIYEGGMSMNPEVDNRVPCPECTITMIERERVNHFDVRKIETLITYMETIKGLVESEKLHYKSGSLSISKESDTVGYTDPRAGVVLKEAVSKTYRIHGDLEFTTENQKDNNR